jgi:hypothetical protein
MLDASNKLNSHALSNVKRTVLQRPKGQQRFEDQRVHHVQGTCSRDQGYAAAVAQRDCGQVRMHFFILDVFWLFRLLSGMARI